MSDLHRLRQMSRSDSGDAGGDGKAVDHGLIIILALKEMSEVPHGKSPCFRVLKRCNEQ